MLQTYSCQEMRDLDRYAVEVWGIPSLLLMENAARSLADALEDWWRGEKQYKETGLTGNVLLLCGKGNNGGDGFALARHLFRRGWSCETVGCDSPDHWKGDAETNRVILEKIQASPPKTSLTLWYLDESTFPLQLARSLNRASLVVDALLGTGAKGEPRYPYNRVIDMVNRSKKPVFSVDIPSGLDGDSGKAAASTIRAACTCTLAGYKTGLLAPQADRWTGRLVLGDIGIPSR